MVAIFRWQFSDQKACNFIKKEAPTQVFCCEIFEIFDNAFFEEHLRTAASRLFSFFEIGQNRGKSYTLKTRRKF